MSIPTNEMWLGINGVNYCDAPGIKPLGMSDPPLAIINCDVPAASIHGFKEGHLVMWLMLRVMARGQQKIQSQQKNAKKASDKKKGQAADQKTAAKAALVHTCPVCRVSPLMLLLMLRMQMTQMPDPKTFKQHFESKHPKSPMPPELVDVQA
ncbi:Zinc finger protein 706 [Merluccius polli]|uniref:Zinc finger protein 706 n=1 Tax=Merluccius polli TaxID=89951 RepID=A0AA47P0Q8_MERPO|nr:Zinc finger protein 706 [Merluccius polli]